MRRSLKRNFGLTLIELLVVVAIISVLVALLMPAIARVRSAAKTLVCASSQRQLGSALNAYASMNRGVIALSYSRASGPTWWPSFLASDPSLRAVVAGPYRNGGYPPPGSYGGTTARCPMNGKWTGGGFSGPSYGLVNRGSAVGKFTSVSLEQPGNIKLTFAGYRLSVVKAAGRQPLATDSGVGSVFAASPMLYFKDCPYPGFYVDDSSGGNGGNRGGCLDRAWLAHPNNTMNILFMDGHVETCSWGEVKALGFGYYWDNDQNAYP